MANNVNGNGVIANGPRPRDSSPDLRHRGCWSRFLCLGTRKRTKRIAPSRLQEGAAGAAHAWAGANGAASSSGANQFVGLSPSLLAPPSSPASFVNSGNPSSVQSPAGFQVSLCVSSANACSPAFDSTATMFTIGPYAHETTLVTPPAFSAFTTAPSTAPFTPPPELAHLTTPSSPDVPFAQLLASSLNAKSEQTGPYSASPFASPDYISKNDMRRSYQLYPESPLGNLISPASGISEPPSPLPELEFPAQKDDLVCKAQNGRVSSFLSLEPSGCNEHKLSRVSIVSICKGDHSVFSDQEYDEAGPIFFTSQQNVEFEESMCKASHEGAVNPLHGGTATRQFMRYHRCESMEEDETIFLKEQENVDANVVERAFLSGKPEEKYQSIHGTGLKTSWLETVTNPSIATATEEEQIKFALLAPEKAAEEHFVSKGLDHTVLAEYSAVNSSVDAQVDGEGNVLQLTMLNEQQVEGEISSGALCTENQDQSSCMASPKSRTGGFSGVQSQD